MEKDLSSFKVVAQVSVGGDFLANKTLESI